jgi:hypothetical protein
MSKYLKKHKKLSKYFIEPRESQLGKTIMTIRVMKHLLAADFSETCDTEDDAVEIFEKQRFYVYCAVNWSLHLREITEMNENLLGVVDICFSLTGPCKDIRANHADKNYADNLPKGGNIGKSSRNNSAFKRGMSLAL